jgi:hypothetical protein
MTTMVKAADQIIDDLPETVQHLSDIGVVRDNISPIKPQKIPALPRKRNPLRNTSSQKLPKPKPKRVSVGTTSRRPRTKSSAPSAASAASAKKRSTKFS